MATIAATQNALQKTESTNSLKNLIEQSVKELGRALPNSLKPERLVRIALTCIRLNPDLAKCTPESFLGALFTSAQLGIEPIAGRAYLLPFNNSRKKADGTWHTVKECQFVLGYKGVADLFYNHEKSVQLDWGVVRENDDFKYELGTNSFLKHIPAISDRGAVLQYYVIATLQNGGKPFMVMSRNDCLAHGMQHSKTFDKKKAAFYDSSPWKTSEDSMCLKTVLVQLAKILPLSVETQRALGADESSREFRKGIDDALDLPDTTNWDAVKADADKVIEAEIAKDPNDTSIEPA